ncbi:MAG: hypothetical protein CEE38_19100 [Planctomycetes bacterium B3_Pla]|nr:MAG: hypothetical protein CEE38_19100 [Planctomycetes bacterium B3_Pla]
MNDRRTVAKKRRKIKFSHVLIALLLAGVAAFAYFRLSTKFKLRAGIDAIRAAGYPVTCAELDQWYNIPPDAENAAYIIEDAFSFYKKWDREKSKSLPLVGKAKLPPRTESLPAEMKALIVEFIADNNEAIELLHAGAAVEHCRYPIDLSAGFATLVPNLSEMRGCVRLLELEAVLHAENGDGRSATRSAISGFGIARSLAKEPVMISQLVRAGCQAIAILTVEQVVNRTELTDEQLVELIEHVRNSERSSDIFRAFVGERCTGISVFRAPGSVGSNILGGGVPLKPALALYRAAGMADADAVIYLDLMDGYLKAARLPLHQRREAVKAVEAKLQATSKAHILLHMIMPALSRVTTIEMRAIAHLRTAQVALAIQRYRLAAGALPDKLADLVPAYIKTVPKDPFDGNELRYRKLDTGGFVVYSVGEDLSDDDGKEKPPRRPRGQKLPNWDVTFIVER